jgi:hypothetical protein
MKRLLLALFCFLVFFALPAAGQQTETVKVNANSVNLRRGASVDSGIVQALAKGTLLTVLARDGNWVKVRVQGQAASGWVRSDLVDAVPVTPAAATPPPARKSAAPTSSGGKDDSYRGGFTLFGGLTSFSINAATTTSIATYDNASGVAAGIGFIAHLGGPVGLELDGDYVQSGFNYVESIGPVSIAGTIHDNNVGGALLLRPAFGSGPVRGFLQGGVSIAYAINCSENYSDGTATTCKFAASQNRTGEALVIGAGASYRMLALQVRYHIGLNNMTTLSGQTGKSKGLLVLLSVIL